MPVRYKLTDPNRCTRGRFNWTVDEWKETDGHGDLCGPGWLHCYSSPALALLLNPIHADIRLPRLWECEVEGRSRYDKLKEGWTRMRLVREMPVPILSTSQHIYFAIRCARTVCRAQEWLAWADNWLCGIDRTYCTDFDATMSMLPSASITVRAANAARLTHQATDARSWALSRAVAIGFSAHAAELAFISNTKFEKQDFDAFARKALAWRDPYPSETVFASNRAPTQVITEMSSQSLIQKPVTKAEAIIDEFD